MHVLGVVPAPGDDWILDPRVDVGALLLGAACLLDEVSDGPVLVVVGPGRPLAGSALSGATVAVDVAELPGDEVRVRAALTAAELVVVHDPRCPGVPPAFLRDLVARAVAGQAAVGVRPVVDTLKATVGGVVTATVDRESLRMVCSPLVVAGALLADVADLPGRLGDLGRLVTALREHGPLELVVAPEAARRAEDPSALALLALQRERPH